MPIFLPDVNVLVALHNPLSAGYQAAQHWFEEEGKKGWATCPLTENGFVRVTAQTLHSARLDSVHIAYLLLEGTKTNYRDSYQFWSDSVSLSDTDLFLPSAIAGPKQITDVYLLGLCQRNGGTLVTLDTHMTTNTILSPHTELLSILPIT